MRVAVYGRVSTADKDQDVEVQLVPLRDHCKAQGWAIVEEFVDEASANDLRRRVSWRKLLDHSTRPRPGFQTVLVFKLDRAFRSVKDMHDTLAVWSERGIDFRALREEFDTSTATGRLMMNLLASFAEFETEIIRERVRAGLDHARKRGVRLGRPMVRQGAAWEKRFAPYLHRLLDRTISIRAAARALGVSPRTVLRARDQAAVQKGAGDDS